MKSIQTKLIALMLACVFLSCSLVGLISLSRARRSATDDSARVAALTLDCASQAADAELLGMEQLVDLLCSAVANTLTWEDSSSRALSVLSHQLEDTSDAFSNLRAMAIYLDPTCCPPDGQLITLDRSRQPRIVSGSASGADLSWAAISSATWTELSSGSEGSLIRYAAPVLLDGRQVGAVGALMECSALLGTGAAGPGVLYLTSREGALLYPQTADMSTPASLSCPLRSGLVLNMAPLAVQNQAWWSGMMLRSTAMVAIISILAGLVTAWFTRRLIRPLRDLNRAAKSIAAGDLSVQIRRESSDEIGDLAESLAATTDHLRQYIGSLNSRIYQDALTGVKNRGAYLEAVEHLDARIRAGGIRFGVVMFDVNYLKQANDTYGHDVGDRLIVDNCRIICQVFQHSPVYRFGGDEFVVLLENQDLERRDELLVLLDKQIDAYNRAGSRLPLPLSLSRGLAVYDPASDRSYADVFRRADNAMYANKELFKQKADPLS